MATRGEGGSGWAQRRAAIMEHIGLACNSVIRIAKESLSYLNEKLTSRNEYGMIRPFELTFRIYELNNRISRMSKRRQTIMRSLLGMLAVVCMCIAFCAIYYCAILDSPRRAIDTLIGTFEYPSLPTRSRKVFLFFKISCAICIVYNMLIYMKEMHTERVLMMDNLEKEAAVIIPGQSTEARLDSTVPRVGDGCKTEKARQLIAIRRLFHRGEFKFDVVPEPMPVRVYEPPEEDIKALTEMAKFEAVKRLKDPKMLREFIRKRESRQGRRNVHFGNLKQRGGKISIRDWTMACALNVINGQDCESLSNISLDWSDESLISNKPMKSHCSKTDTTESTSEISLSMDEEDPIQDDGDPFSSHDLSSQEDELKTSPTIRARKVNTNRVPGMPRPRTPTPLRGRAGPSNVNPTSGARATAVGAAKAPAGVVAAGTKRNGPLQTAKWPISGTCRPVRSRPPSPGITPTVLKPPGVSPGGDFSSASKQRRTPSAGPGPKASTVAATAVESNKRYSRSAVRRVAPSNPARVTMPSRSSPSPPPPSTPVSSPTRRPNSSVRRHTLPPPRVASPVVRPPKPQHTSSPTTSFSIPRPATRQRTQRPSLPTPSPQGKTPQSPTTPPRKPGPQSRTTPPSTPGPQSPTNPPRTPGPQSPTTPPSTPGPQSPTTPPSTPGPQSPTTPPSTPGPQSPTNPPSTPGPQSPTNPPSTPGPQNPTTPHSTPGPQTPTTPQSTTAPQRITPPGSPATPCETPPSKPSPTSVMGMSMDIDVIANGGGEAPCRSANLSPATSFVNTTAIHQEPTKSSPVRQKPPSAPTSPPKQPQRRRTRTGDGGSSAATAGLRQSVAESAYKKWRENFASPKLRVVPNSQGSGGQGPVIYRERRSLSCTPVKPDIKSAEGTRMWHKQQRAEAAVKEQNTKLSISNVSVKLSSSVSDTTETLGKVIKKDSDPKEKAGGDSHTHISLKDQNSEQIEQVQKKSETEISNLLDPRPIWSDSGSSMSGISPSFKNICQAYAEDVALNGPPMYD